MSLIDLYNAASSTSTYVGRVRTTQAGIRLVNEEEQTSSDLPLSRGVNLTDAFKRNAGDGAADTTTEDTLQKEFTRNPPGAFKYAGAGKVPGTGVSDTDKNNLTRWTGKALQFAFTDPGIIREGNVAGSLFDLYKNRIRANHKYTPSETGLFRMFRVQLPTNFQKDRATRGIPAPSPAGLNG